jgi:hypothetical protein
MIEMSKKYRNKLGQKVRILCTDSKDQTYPVVGLVEAMTGFESVEIYTKDGRYHCDDESEQDLIEISEWDDFEIDEPVMVMDRVTGDWIRRYFAEVDELGRPCTWVNGCTKWTSEGDKTHWEQCRRPTAEELAP